MIAKVVERSTEYDVVIINMLEILELPAKDSHSNVEDASPLVAG